MMMMMMMMMTMNCFCGMVDPQKEFSLIPAGAIVKDPHHRKLIIESTTRRKQAGFEPASNLSLLSEVSSSDNNYTTEPLILRIDPC